MREVETSGATSRRNAAGFSISEMLVVLAIIGITVAIGIPLVNEQVRIAEVRGAADQMAVHLRAARMMAVARHRDIKVTVNNENVAAPLTNTLQYEGQNGGTQTISLPAPVKIKSSSTAEITFHSDGSSDATSTVTTESVVSTSTERWTLNVNTLGLVTVAHVRV